VDSRFDDTRLGGGSLGRAIGEVGSTARGTARRGRRQLGVGGVGILELAVVVVVLLQLSVVLLRSGKVGAEDGSDSMDMLGKEGKVVADWWLHAESREPAACFLQWWKNRGRSMEERRAE